MTNHLVEGWHSFQYLLSIMANDPGGLGTFIVALIILPLVAGPLIALYVACYAAYLRRRGLL